MIARFLPFKHSNARDGKISISDRALRSRVFSQDNVDVSVSGANGLTDQCEISLSSDRRASGVFSREAATAAQTLDEPDADPRPRKYFYLECNQLLTQAPLGTARCLSWVKLRRTLCEQISCTLPILARSSMLHCRGLIH
jgi:hypothetical protein